MNIWGWALVIFLTALAALLGFAWLLGRGLARYDRIMLRDKLDQTVAVPQLPRAGRLDLIPRPGSGGPELFDLPTVLLQTGPYGPFPVDTGPLLILSEKAAANVALEREIQQRCAEAEAKIPPRWR